MAARPTDPILEVTGLPAAVILDRCAALRAGHGAQVGLVPAGHVASPREAVAVPLPPERQAWRLVDFADLADAEFIAAAHLALLGRPPYAPEMARRSAELAAGRTRVELLARLIFSPEGRTAQGRRIGGIALPSLVGLARILHRIRVRGLHGPAEAPRAASRQGGGSRAGIGDWFAGFWHLGQMRREVLALRKEIEDLRKGLRK